MRRILARAADVTGYVTAGTKILALGLCRIVTGAERSKSKSHHPAARFATVA